MEADGISVAILPSRKKSPVDWDESAGDAVIRKEGARLAEKIRLEK
jgi:hypothetical protein